MPLIIPLMELDLGEPVETHVYTALASLVVDTFIESPPAFTDLTVEGNSLDPAHSSLVVRQQLEEPVESTLTVKGNVQSAALSSLTAGEEAEYSHPLTSLEVLGGSGIILYGDIMSATLAGGAGVDPGTGDLEDPPPVSGGGPGPGPGPGAPDPDPAAGTGYLYQVAARLTGADSGAIPISSFRYSQSDNTIGSQLSFVCADPLQEIDDNDELTFEIGIKKSGSMEWSTIMDIGRIRSLTSRVGFENGAPTDGSSGDAIDSLAEKWDLAPAQSIVLYDPDEIDIVDEAGDTQNEAIDETGAVIEPQFTAMDSLDLHQLLNFVYVEKLGYSRVITNIPNYKIPRVDLPLTDAYHAAIVRELTVFEPVYATQDLTTLFIVDPHADLPAGLKIRGLKLKHYAAFERSQQRGRLVNAVLLSYRENTLSDSGTVIIDRVEQEVPQEVGIFGQDGWQRTLLTRFIKDFFDENDVLIRTIVWKIDTRVSARVGSIVREVLHEVQTDSYILDWNLKNGYTKTTDIFTELPDGSGGLTGAIMRTAQTEVNQIVWAASRLNPGEYVKQWENTEIRGIVLEIETDDPERPFRQSLLSAAQQQSINPDATVLMNQGIATQTSRFREIATDQIEENLTKIDQLTGQPQRSQTFQHTGTLAVRAVARISTVVRMLVKGEDWTETNARPPVGLDAGNLPFVVARPLADRILQRAGRDPIRFTVPLAGIDLNIRRGSVRNIHDRIGNRFIGIITGQEIVGENLGRSDFSVRQTVTGIVRDA